MTRPGGGALLRGALAVLAVAVGAWLASGLQSARLQTDGDAIGRSGDLSAGRFDEARDLYRRARDGNPGTDPERIEGQLLIAGGKGRAAIPVLLSVVRREPENAHAWGMLAYAARTSHPELARRARERLAELRPEGDD
jgi:hypothetical protein